MITNIIIKLNYIILSKNRSYKPSKQAEVMAAFS